MSETGVRSNFRMLEKGEEEIVFNPEGMRVLAIDANVVSLAYLVAILQKCKYEVTSTTKADEALEILRKNKGKYDIVTTDVIRLDMDGFRLLEIVSLEMDVPVILVTAEDNQSSIMKGIMHGARDYLLKPVRIQEIKNIWQHVVRKKLSRITREIKSQEYSKSSGNQDDGDYEEANNESDCNSSCPKKPRLKWSPELHSKFVNAVQQLGHVVHPKKVLEFMNEPSLSRDQVASHLQKYRRILKKQKEKTSQPHLKTLSIPFMDAGNQELFDQFQQNTKQPLNQTQQWMMPDPAVPEFKELNFSSTFLSAMKLPDQYVGNSSLSFGYSVDQSVPAASSIPFCSYTTSNANFNPPPQVTGQDPVEAGPEEGGYFVNQPSNSREQFNDYPNSSVQYPTLIDLMKNNERSSVQHPCEKSQHNQSSSHHNYSSPSYDDLTELVKQFANDEPPKL